MKTYSRLIAISLLCSILTALVIYVLFLRSPQIPGVVLRNNIPVPKNAEIIHERDGTVYFTTPDSVRTIRAFYQETLEKSGWEACPECEKKHYFCFDPKQIVYRNATQDQFLITIYSDRDRLGKSIQKPYIEVYVLPGSNTVLNGYCPSVK